jgi:hypothetical protein
MDSEKIINYIQSPFDLNLDDFNELEQVLIKYPFFHSANMLYVKAAHNIKSDDFNKIVNRVSASIPNREFLHDLIMLTKKENIEEEIQEKEQESDARKEIRERINQRKKLRILQKGELLLDSGKQWHQQIVSDFFSPMIKRFIELPDIDVVNSIDKKRLAGSTSEKSDLDRIKEEREKRRLERLQKREERFLQKNTEDKGVENEEAFQKDTSIISNEKDIEREKRKAERMAEREKRMEQRLKEKTREKELLEESKIDNSIHIKTVEDNENIIVEIESTTIQTDSEEKDSIIQEEEIIESIDDIPSTEHPYREKQKKEKLFVEDIPQTKDNEETEDVQIEDIYDKIISSKKVDIEINKNDIITEIKDNKTIEEISIEKEILATDIRPEDITQETDKNIISSSTDDEKETEILDFITEDKAFKNEIDIEIHEKDNQINITVENPSDEMDVEFELIERKEDDNFKQTDELIKEEAHEHKSIDEAKIEKSNEVENKDILEQISVEDKELTVNEKESEDKHPIEIKEDTKAANDIFARIEAYKKKKENIEHKEENAVNKDELIEKFVNEQPSIKISPPKDEDQIDLSETSIKEKKPVETELMANIFINQGKFDQAIAIFEKLILKNPEKKDYFAAKIDELKNLKA